jgi:hypothetical protein
MKFTQFFPVSGFAHEAFLLTESLEGHSYYSEEAESADFAAGDYAARDTRANDGLLKLWSFGGAPEEIHLVAGTWSESDTVAASEWEAFASWLASEAGASTTEAEQIIEALRREAGITEERIDAEIARQHGEGEV